MFIVNEFREFLVGDMRWIFSLSVACCLLVLFIVWLVFRYNIVVLDKNLGLFKQINEQYRLEIELRKAKTDILNLRKRLQQNEVQAAANMPELYLLATEKPLSASFAEENLINGSLKIFPLREVEAEEG